MADRQTELQQRLLALEMAREETRARHARSANVRATVQKTAQNWRLIIVNEGRWSRGT